MFNYEKNCCCYLLVSTLPKVTIFSNIFSGKTWYYNYSILISVILFCVLICQKYQAFTKTKIFAHFLWIISSHHNSKFWIQYMNASFWKYFTQLPKKQQQKLKSRFFLTLFFLIFIYSWHISNLQIHNYNNIYNNKKNNKVCICCEELLLWFIDQCCLIFKFNQIWCSF